MANPAKAGDAKLRGYSAIVRYAGRVTESSTRPCYNTPMLRSLRRFLPIAFALGCATDYVSAPERSGADLEWTGAIRVEMGDTARLPSRVLDDEGEAPASNVRAWSVSDSTVALVEDGLVVPLRAGNTTARVAVGAVVMSASVAVWGSVVPESLTVTPESAQVTVGQQEQLSTALSYSNGRRIWLRSSVGWTTLDPSVAMVSAGRVTAVGPGVARIVASVLGYADTATIAVVGSITSLRAAGDARGVSMGAAVDAAALRSDDSYRDLLASEYNSVVPENSMKFVRLHPTPNAYDFRDADALVSFASTNGMSVHGHTLVWYAALPSWLTSQPTTRSAALDILKQHITTVVSRYRGKVKSWDVVNEAIADDGRTLRPGYWLDAIGADYIDSAFVWARRADPAAELYLADYDIEVVSRKANTALTLVTSLRSKGVPIDGMNFQSHLALPAPDQSALTTNFARFAAAGLSIRIGELDVRIPSPATASTLAAQAEVYGAVARACLAQARCSSITTWGFTDRVSWIPDFFPGMGRALPFDEQLHRKPAYYGLLSALLP